jgi:hypothetical protein
MHQSDSNLIHDKNSSHYVSTIHAPAIHLGQNRQNEHSWEQKFCSASEELQHAPNRCIEEMTIS